jgi:hypothetical protein
VFLIDRARLMPFGPASAWPQLVDDATTRPAILVRYVLPLAAIGPVARCMHLMLFQDAPPWRALTEALAFFACDVAGVFLIAWVAAACAPLFGGIRDTRRAFRWAAYGLTVHMLGGAFFIVTFGYVFAFLATLVSLYVLDRGLQPALRVAANKAAGLMAIVSIAALFALWILPSALGLAIGFLAA